MSQTFGDLAGLISLVSLCRRKLFSLLSSSLSARLVLQNVLGWGNRDRGVNLMPMLTSAAILSANPKRGEAGERSEGRRN